MSTTEEGERSRTERESLTGGRDDFFIVVPAMALFTHNGMCSADEYQAIIAKLDDGPPKRYSHFLSFHLYI